MKRSTHNQGALPRPPWHRRSPPWVGLGGGLAATSLFIGLAGGGPAAHQVCDTRYAVDEDTVMAGVLTDPNGVAITDALVEACAFNDTGDCVPVDMDGVVAYSGNYFVLAAGALKDAVSNAVCESGDPIPCDPEFVISFNAPGYTPEYFKDSLEPRGGTSFKFVEVSEETTFNLSSSLSPAPYISGSARAAPQSHQKGSALAGDFDKDGLIDFVFISQQRIVTVYGEAPAEEEASSRDGTQGSPPPRSIPANARVTPPLPSPQLYGLYNFFDAEGEPKHLVVVASGVGGGIFIYDLDSLSLRWRTPVEPSSNAGVLLENVRVADVDGDGQLELIYSHAHPSITTPSTGWVVDFPLGSFSDPERTEFEATNNWAVMVVGAPSDANREGQVTAPLWWANGPGSTFVMADIISVPEGESRQVTQVDVKVSVANASLPRATSGTGVSALLPAVGGGEATYLYCNIGDLGCALFSDDEAAPLTWEISLNPGLTYSGYPLRGDLNRGEMLRAPGGEAIIPLQLWWDLSLFDGLNRRDCLIQRWPPGAQESDEPDCSLYAAELMDLPVTEDGSEINTGTLLVHGGTGALVDLIPGRIPVNVGDLNADGQAELVLATAVAAGGFVDVGVYAWEGITGGGLVELALFPGSHHIQHRPIHPSPGFSRYGLGLANSTGSAPIIDVGGRPALFLGGRSYDYGIYALPLEDGESEGEPGTPVPGEAEVEAPLNGKNPVTSVTVDGIVYLILEQSAGGSSPGFRADALTLQEGGGLEVTTASERRIVLNDGALRTLVATGAQGKAAAIAFGSYICPPDFSDFDACQNTNATLVGVGDLDGDGIEEIVFFDGKWMLYIYKQTRTIAESCSVSPDASGQPWTRWATIGGESTGTEGWSLNSARLAMGRLLPQAAGHAGPAQQIALVLQDNTPNNTTPDELWVLDFAKACQGDVDDAGVGIPDLLTRWELPPAEAGEPPVIHRDLRAGPSVRILDHDDADGPGILIADFTYARVERYPWSETGPDPVQIAAPGCVQFPPQGASVRPEEWFPYRIAGFAHFASVHHAGRRALLSAYPQRWGTQSEGCTQPLADSSQTHQMTTWPYNNPAYQHCALANLRVEEGLLEAEDGMDALVCGGGRGEIEIYDLATHERLTTLTLPESEPSVGLLPELTLSGRHLFRTLPQRSHRIVHLIAADYDNDGVEEILVAADDGWIYAFAPFERAPEGDAELEEGDTLPENEGYWPHLEWRIKPGSSAWYLETAQVDDDPTLEILVATVDGKLWTLDFRTLSEAPDAQGPQRASAQVDGELPGCQVRITTPLAGQCSSGGLTLTGTSDQATSLWIIVNGAPIPFNSGPAEALSEWSITLDSSQAPPGGLLELEVWSQCEDGSWATDTLTAEAGELRAEAEVSDGIDNDCDGFVDENIDHDGDTFGNGEDGDCNDADPQIHPDAQEVCDWVDQDCDGQIDEGFDADGDGFTTCAEDCDDSDPAVHPNAIDVTGDGIDNDCDEEIDEGPEPGTGCEEHAPTSPGLLPAGLFALFLWRRRRTPMS